MELSIYDRWGGLLYKGKEWDGGTANQGIYLYELTYFNQRSKMKEELNGEVLLVK
jgi:hypothetical protein